MGCAVLAPVVADWALCISTNSLWLDCRIVARKALFSSLPLLVEKASILNTKKIILLDHKFNNVLLKQSVVSTTVEEQVHSYLTETVISCIVALSSHTPGLDPHSVGCVVRTLRHCQIRCPTPIEKTTVEQQKNQQQEEQQKEQNKRGSEKDKKCPINISDLKLNLSPAKSIGQYDEKFEINRNENNGDNGVDNLILLQLLEALKLTSAKYYRTRPSFTAVPNIDLVSAALRSYSSHEFEIYSDNDDDSDNEKNEKKMRRKRGSLTKRASFTKKNSFIHSHSISSSNINKILSSNSKDSSGSKNNCSLRNIISIDKLFNDDRIIEKITNNDTNNRKNNQNNQSTDEDDNKNTKTNENNGNNGNKEGNKVENNGNKENSKDENNGNKDNSKDEYKIDKVDNDGDTEDDDDDDDDEDAFSDWDEEDEVVLSTCVSRKSSFCLGDEITAMEEEIERLLPYLS